LHEKAIEDKGKIDSFTMEDQSGAASKLWLTQDLEDTIYTSFATSERIVGRIQHILDDRIVHYHHKMMLKEPKVGGSWEWHQDYGYWYNDGFLFPNMISCMVACRC